MEEQTLLSSSRPDSRFPTHGGRLPYVLVLGLAALVTLLAPAPAQGRDLLLSSKLKPTSLSIRDVTYEPRGTISLWKFRFHPFLRQELEYDTNVYFDDSSPHADLLYFTSLGLRVDLLPGNHEVNFGYKARVLEYANSNDIDRIEHVADLRGVLAFKNLRFEVSNVFEKLRDPLNLLFTRAIDRMVDATTVQVLGKIGQILLGAQYQLFWYDFRGAFDTLDHVSHSGGAQVKVRLTPRIELMADYAFTHLDYDASTYDDYQTHAVYVGAGGLITPKIRGMAKVGFIYQEIVESITGDEPYQGFSALLTLAWAPTENFKLDLSYVRTIEFSQYRSYQVVDRGELKAEQYFGPKVSVSFFASLELTDPADRPGGDAYQQEWFLRTVLGVRLEYRMQDWLATGLWLEYQNRTTDIEDESYDALQMGAHVTVFF